MADIFKTTLKRDVIADIANNNINEIRFPITKFWASRLTNEYNLEEKTFIFRNFDSLEVSSPSNKDTEGETYSLAFVKTTVDGDEFIIEFKRVVDTEDVSIDKEDEKVELETSIVKDDVQNEDSDLGDESYTIIPNDEIFTSIKEWFDVSKVLDAFYEYETVFATNARQIIVLPKGKVLGFKKTLPVNNDAEVRIEFDMSNKIYFDRDFEAFEDDIFKVIDEIRKNNFVFIWKRYTGIFMDDSGRIYFGIKYSTRKSIGFNRKYYVQ